MPEDPRVPAAALVRPVQLVEWIVEEVGLHPSGPLTVQRLSGGNSNETLLLGGFDLPLVLRRPPLASMAPDAHSMAREHRVLEALAPTPVPVPTPIGLCEDPDVIGAPFYVMEHIRGTSVGDTLPPAYDGRPDAVGALGRSMVDALATLHAVDPQAVGLGDLGRPDGFLDRQVGRWRAQLERHRVRDLPHFDDVGDWLAANQPPDGRPGILHGDFHLDNCLTSLTEPRVLAIIDWEMTTVGDPLLDVGLTLGLWGERHLEPCALPHVQAVSRRAGAPTRDELAARYAERSGRSVEHLTYYMVLALWKLAAIIEGAYALYTSGQVNSPYAAALERDVPALVGEAAACAGVGAPA